MRRITLGAAVAATLTLLVAQVAHAENWQGGDQANTHHGTSEADSLYGGAGNDKIFGEGGADIIYGQTGADTLHGGAGIDYVDVGINDDPDGVKDVGYGDADNDQVLGRGPDKLYGGSGDDYVYLMNPTKKSVVNCGTGDDTLSANIKKSKFPGKMVGCERYVGHIGG